MSESIGEVSWNKMLEEYFASTAERSHCLGWLHKKAEERFSTRRNFIDLPVIVGSGIIAFLNAGSSSLFTDATMSSVALGVGSLAVGILNTMGTYFGWARRAEQHRISALQYERLYRFLSVEMSLPRAERMAPKELLKYTRDSIDRLAEISPLIPQPIIADFRQRFAEEKDIAKPVEANGLEKVIVFPETEEMGLPSASSLRIRIPRPPLEAAARATDGLFGSPPATAPARAVAPLAAALSGAPPTRPYEQSAAASSSLEPFDPTTSLPRTAPTLARPSSAPEADAQTHH